MERNNTEVPKIVLGVVEKMVDFVKITFGHKNKGILTKSPKGLLALDDGYRIVMDFSLDDPLEKAVVDLIKDDITKYNKLYGEGTTGFLILMRAFLRGLLKPEANQELQREAVEEAKQAIRELSKPIKTKKDLEAVALTSFSNEKISKMIADFAFEHGENTHLGIEYSPTQETYIEQADGYEIENGTSDKAMPQVLDNPLVLLTDQVISDGQPLVDLMDKIIKSNQRNLVIVAKKVDGTALATVLQNHINNVFHTMVIEGLYPESLEDLQLITGGEVFKQAIGLDLGKIRLSQLGKAKRVVAKDNSSFLVGSKQSAELKKFCATLKNNPKRLAKLSNVVGIIKIGAPSAKEVDTIQYKVEDVIRAVGQAQKGGMVKGAGQTLAQIKTRSYLINKALKAPLEQLKENASLEEIESEGIFDPTNVIIGQVESAFSLASLLAWLGGIQAEKKKDGNN